MYLDLKDEQKMLAQTARRFVEKECPSAKVRQVMATENADDPELWQKMAGQGWMGLTVPEEYGGLGESWLTVAGLFEDLGRGLLPGPFLATVALAAPLLAKAGNANQKARWLPMIAEGNCRATVAYLEPANTYELTAINTTAEPDSTGKFWLNGTKMFALDAAVSDIIIVSAKSGDEFGLFLVEKGTNGLQVNNLEGMDLTRRQTRITLDNVLAEKLDGTGDAVAALEHALDCAALAISAESLGGISWIIDTSVAYARSREQYGRLIGSYQAVAHPLADRAMELNSSRSAVYNAAFALDHRGRDEIKEAVSMAKALACDSYRQAAYTGTQTHGGIGFTWEHDMHLYFRRAAANWSLFGDPNWHRERMLKVIGL